MKHATFFAKCFTSAVALTLLVFTPIASASKFKTLYSFTGGADGRTPLAGLIFDQAGNLYGTTYAGGNSDLCPTGCGTVFELSPNGDGTWRENVIYALEYPEKGPASSLIFDPAGNLYGTAVYGGVYGDGSAFELTPNGDGSWTSNVLHSFIYDFVDGHYVSGGLVMDKSGNLYGTTDIGGDACFPNGCGTVYELSPNGDGTWTETILHSFANDGRYGYNDGMLPLAGMIFDASGNLYGTTANGGNGDGTVFELSPNGDGTWNEKILHSFVNDTYCPHAGVIFDSAGNLYGTTYNGFYGPSAIFELTPNPDGSWSERLLYAFADDGKSGYLPAGGVVMDDKGNLYGTTSVGGAYGYGVVYQFGPKSSIGRNTEYRVQPFANHPGAYPYSTLIFDSSGNLYGTTSGDGVTTFGSVFEITP